MRQPSGKVFLVAVAINVPWEMAQAYLSAPMGDWVPATTRCFGAAIVDGVIVLGIMGGVSLELGRPDCICDRRGQWRVGCGRRRMRIPALLQLFGVPIIEAGTLSLAVSIPTVAASAFTDRRLGGIPHSSLRLAVLMGVASAVGVLIGAAPLPCGP